jgi:outer membrane receptor protein involved in Fe transport
MKKFFDLGLFSLIACAVLATSTYTTLLQAQVLEEIIVTAQRREQVIQDVPVSLEVLSGDDLTAQGIESLRELSVFVPGLNVQDKGEEQGIILRGAGSQSKNLALEQGVPTFVDGIHFGRASQVKNQFLDLAQVEVLKGPQPVYFGQNAGAGALNITTRKPGAEWEGFLNGEFGNFGSREVEAAFGGPITETLGIRVAGRYDILEGWLRDYYTGRKFPQRESQLARVTLQWTPNDQFQATTKFEISKNDIGPRPTLLVRDAFTLDKAQGESVLISGIEDISGTPAYRAAPGTFSNVGNLQGAANLSVNLFGDRIFSGNGPSRQNGTLDVSSCTDLSAPGIALFEKFENCDWEDDAGSTPYHGIVDLAYEMDNGITINSKTGFSHHAYWNKALNTGGPFVTNPRSRDEELDQWSTELRISSPTDGQFSWTAGFYWQDNDHDMWNTQMNTDGRRQIRGSITSVDSTWTSAFASVTYNFLDDKASLDLGGRYTHIKKFGKGRNTAAAWIVEHPTTGLPYTMPLGRYAIPLASDLAGGYDVAAISGDPFGFHGAKIIGRSSVYHENSNLPAFSKAGNAFGNNSETYKENNFDPQVVLRYRPSDNVSLYAKWVESVKSGGFDGGVVEITPAADAWSYGPEFYRSYEIGSKGTFFDGRLRLDLAAYLMEIKGQQVSNVDFFLQRNVTANAAAGETKGVEIFATFAASDRLTLTASASIMDAIVKDFPNGVCTVDERLLGLGSVDDNGRTICDRSGQQARNAPDWQVTTWVNYELPTIIEGYRSNFSGVFTASAAYKDNRSFADTVSFAAYEDISLSFEVGDIDEDWSVSFWARNLLEVRPTLFLDLDKAGDGVLSAGDGAQVPISGYATYGISFGLNFQ